MIWKSTTAIHTQQIEIMGAFRRFLTSQVTDVFIKFLLHLQNNILFEHFKAKYAIMDKIYETMSRNQAKLKGQETFDTCFCVIFEYQYQSFISEGRLTTRLRLHSFLRFFQYILIS